MPRWPKKTTEADERILPFALKRELEEITKNSGRVFDLSLPINELEAICNDANRPSDAWRHRWRG